MTMWPPDPALLKRPAYRSLAVAMTQAIETGVFGPGDRLPTHRELAYDLGLSVHTVSRAYEELTRLGVISGEVGRGSFVLRSGSGEVRPPWHRIGSGETVVDCSMLTPVAGEIHGERFRAALAELAEDVPPETLFSFRPRAALQRHADVGVRWLRRCGVTAERENVLPTNGSTPAMTIALMTAASPGDLVLTEELGHHTLPMLTRFLGLRLAGLPVDGEGVLPDAFEAACHSGEAKVLFLVPNGLNPMARMMGAERRRAICAIADRHNVMIVENNSGGPRRPRPAAAAGGPVAGSGALFHRLQQMPAAGIALRPAGPAGTAGLGGDEPASGDELDGDGADGGDRHPLDRGRDRARPARLAAQGAGGAQPDRGGGSPRPALCRDLAWTARLDAAGAVLVGGGVRRSRPASRASRWRRARPSRSAIRSGSAACGSVSARGRSAILAHGLSILARLARNEPEPGLLTG